MSPEEKKKLIKKLIVSVIGLALLVGVVWLCMHLLGITGITREQVQDAVESTGAVAPIVFIFLTFLHKASFPGTMKISTGMGTTAITNTSHNGSGHSLQPGLKS